MLRAFQREPFTRSYFEGYDSLWEKSTRKKEKDIKTKKKTPFLPTMPIQLCISCIVLIVCRRVSNLMLEWFHWSSNPSNKIFLKRSLDPAKKDIWRENEFLRKKLFRRDSLWSLCLRCTKSIPINSLLEISSLYGLYGRFANFKIYLFEISI